MDLSKMFIQMVLQIETYCVNNTSIICCNKRCPKMWK